MSAIRAYLEEKAALPEKEWLRREPRETHPAILAAVRARVAAGLPGRTVYDEDVERAVHDVAGDLPAYLRHAHPDRDRLIVQLGRECYIARGIVRDEESQAALNVALEAGFVTLEPELIEEGGRYLVRFGTLYSGYTVPVYGPTHEVRAVRFGDRLALIPKGKRTHGYAVQTPALVLAVTP